MNDIERARSKKEPPTKVWLVIYQDALTSANDRVVAGFNSEEEAAQFAGLCAGTVHDAHPLDTGFAGTGLKSTDARYYIEEVDVLPSVKEYKRCGCDGCVQKWTYTFKHTDRP